MTDKFAYTNALLRGYVESGRLNGVSASVGLGADTVYHGHFGSVDPEIGLVLNSETIFRLFSVSKLITTIGALILYERGRLHPDDPVSDFLPEYADLRVLSGGPLTEASQASKVMTIGHLLAMTSGLGYGTEGLATDRPLQDLNRQVKEQRETGAGEPISTRDFARRLAAIPLVSQPGKQWVYGYSLDVLGAVIEVVSGLPLSRFFEQEIFEPLEMADTFLTCPAEKRALVAKLHYNNGDGIKLRSSDRYQGWVMAGMDDFVVPGGVEFGGSDFLATAGNCLNFAKMLAGGGTYRGRRIVSPRTLSLMGTPQAGDSYVQCRQAWDLYRGTDYGWGAAVTVQPEVFGIGLPIGTIYWNGVSSTFLAACPAQGLSVVFLAQETPNCLFNFIPKFLTTVFSVIK